MDKNLTELQEIGKRLRDARLAMKLTQAELAFRANVQTNAVSDIELGKQRMMVDTFVRIIEVLQVSADEILRPSVPAVKTMYTGELAELLKDCNSQELSSILAIVKELKRTMRSNKQD